MSDTVTIPKKEYERLKQLAAKAGKDDEFIVDLKESLKDLKTGRVHWSR